MNELDTAMFDISTAKIDRLRPGHWQRSEGAWSWALEIQTVEGGQTFGVCGSQWSATECVKAPYWEIWNSGFDKSIIPYHEKEEDRT
jgi:hypothetical protein